MAKVERYECDRCRTLISSGWELAGGQAVHDRRKSIKPGSYCIPCLLGIVNDNQGYRASEDCGPGCGGCDNCRRGMAYR